MISPYRSSMRGADRRYGRFGTGLAAAAIALTACSASSGERTEVPTFPSDAQVMATAMPNADQGVLPDDCTRILTVGDLEAVLGLPLGSVDVRTTRGVPEPTVSRTERVACSYNGTAGGPARGRTLLNVNSSAYADPDAATKQWRVNADAETGDRRELPIGSASAVLVERSDEAVLMVVNGVTNLTLVLPNQQLPGDRPRGDALVDLALRVLPAVSTSGTAPPPASPSPTASGNAAGLQVAPS
ncbi:hypothetical protein GCM10010464_57470 [Pseudonocardia yunnanensis]